MSKTIKLSDGTYAELERVRGKRETFSQAAQRVLSVYVQIRDIIKTSETWDETLSKGGLSDGSDRQA